MGTLVEGCVECGRTSADGCVGCGAEVRIGEEIRIVVAGNEHEGAEIRVGVGTELVSKGDGTKYDEKCRCV